MPRVPFSDIPSHGRLWVFPASRPLDTDEARTLLDTVDDFLDGWAAHGVPLRSGRDWVDDRFLLVAVDEDATQPSGCSIDALVRGLRELEAALGITLVDHGPVWFREGEEIRCVDRPTFRRLAGEGRVGPDTPVFDTTLTRVAALREAGLERPARDSWHGKAFFGVRA